MRRILCILDSLDAGGAETFMMKLYRGINRNEYQFDFIACKEGIYDKEVREMGGIIHYIPMRRKKFWGAFNGIRSIVRNNNYDVVLKLGSSPIIVTDLIAARLGGAKKICVRSCNAPTNLSPKQRVIDGVLRPIMNIVTNVKIAPSDLAGLYTFGEREVKNGNVNFLHNAVDLSVYRYDDTKRSRIRSELIIENSTLVIGHIGRFVEQKNHLGIISIFEEFQEKHPNSKLLLVGDGPLKKNIVDIVIKKGLDSKVVFAGIRNDVPDLLSAMDIFLLPSLYEGMPNTVIEAQATGLSCVISDTITREVNVSGKVRFCSLENPINSWVEALESAAREERNSMKEIMTKNGYDITESVNSFIKMVF